MTSRAAPDWAVIVLAGGEGTRLGGMDKAAIEIARRRTIDRIIGDLPATVDVVVSGAARPTSRPVRFAQEEPPDGGPVAGVAAAVTRVRTSTVALVAVDMPWGGQALPALMDALQRGRADVVVAVDSTGRRQPLCAAWRTSALRAAIDRLAGGRDHPMNALLDECQIESMAIDDRLLVDIDTADDLARARTLDAMSDDATMQQWIDAVKTELGLTADVDVDVLLDVARVAAHGVARPAAPVTTYLLGLAVGSGADPVASAEAIDALAARWTPSGQP